MSERVKKTHPMLNRIPVLGICLLLLPMLWACENRLVVATALLNQTLAYNINSTGLPSVTVASFDRGNLTSALDIPGDARITNVDIERLALFGRGLPTNEANFFSLLVETRPVGSTTWKVVFRNPIPLPVVALRFIGTGTPLDALVDEGIAALRTSIETNLKGIDDVETEVRVTAAPVTLIGQTVDADLKLQIELIIKATIEYEACTEAFAIGILDSGVPCDPDDFGSFSAEVAPTVTPSETRR